MARRADASLPKAGYVVTRSQPYLARRSREGARGHGDTGARESIEFRVSSMGAAGRARLSEPAEAEAEKRADASPTRPYLKAGYVVTRSRPYLARQSRERLAASG